MRILGGGGNMSEVLTPEEIARKIKRAGIGKAKFDLGPALILGAMAGAFIALGGVFALTIAVSPELGTGPARLLIGVGFSLGLFLVAVTGSELFTGNNLMVASFFSRRIKGRELARNWSLAFVANLIGALVVVFLLYYSRWWAQGEYSFSVRTIQIANDKVNLAFETAFMRGLLANLLVCLAVWMAAAGRTLIDKMVGIIFPITAFVAAGFEHSIANMFFLPLGWMVSADSSALAAAGLTSSEVGRLNFPWILHNLAAVTLGNMVGGVLVGLANWAVYLRRK